MRKTLFLGMGVYRFFFVECDLFDGIWVGQESIKKTPDFTAQSFLD